MRVRAMTLAVRPSFDRFRALCTGIAVTAALADVTAHAAIRAETARAPSGTTQPAAGPLADTGDAAVGFVSGVLHALPVTEKAFVLASIIALALALGSLAAVIVARRRARADRKCDENARDARPPFDLVPIALMRFDASGRLLHCNREASRMLRVPVRSDPTAPITWNTVFGAGTFDELNEALEGESHGDIELPVGAGDTRRWLHVRAAREDAGIETCIEDITHRKDADLRLRHLAHHDPLTGLLNRRGFDVRREAALRAVRDGQSLLLGYLDLDRFKLINDMFGHTAGDHVLRQVAERLRASVRPPHTIARVGGDEFVLLFVSTSSDEARAICEAALEAIRLTPYRFDDKAFSVDGSIGLTRIDAARLEQDIVIGCDRACSEAKRAGGGRVMFVDEWGPDAGRHRDEARFLRTLKDSRPEAILFTQFQPIVSLHHLKNALGYEVLLRMRDENGSVVGPDRFMSAAERTGMASQIDRHVLTHTLNWLDEHPSHRERVAFVGVNIGRASLNDERFIHDLRSILADHSHAAKRLCFEVSESTALGDLVGTQRFLEVIKRFGSRMALDDFGAQYTSFSHMKALRADFVKIDPALVRDLNSNPENFSIVRAIVDVAHDLDMACVGEWAETDGIVRALLELDVDYAQGFALCKPLHPKELLEVNECSSLISDPLIAALLTVDRSASSAQLDLSRRNPTRRPRGMPP